MEHYELSEAQFRSLARGHGTAEAIALLVDTQVSKRRLFLLAAAALPGVFDDVLALVARIDRQAPAAARALLRHPFLDAWFARVAPLLNGATVDDHARDELTTYLGALAAATAVSGGVPFSLALTVRSPELVLPGLGTVREPGHGLIELGYDGTTLVVAGESPIIITAPFTAGSSRWRPARHVLPRSGPPSLALELVDADPLRDRYSEPPLPPGDRTDLAEVVEEAWDVLVAEQPGHAVGMSIALRALVPLRTPDSGALVSAAARDAFGAIGMSVCGDPAAVAELLVHEFQHEKLGALLDLVDLCRPDGRAEHHAPWRLDPRPASALAQGAYAFAGVAGYWRARTASLGGAPGRRAAFRFGYWREQSAFGIDQLLRSGELTAAGARFFTELGHAVRDWQREQVAPGAAEAALLGAVAEQVSWRVANQRPDPAETGVLVDAWLRGLDAPPLSAPVVVPGRPPRTSLRDLLEDHWMTGSSDSTGTDRLIVEGRYGRAAHLLGRRLAGRDDPADRVALAVALVAAGDSGAAIASRRPELLGAVAGALRERGRAPDVLGLARWLSGAPA